MKTLNIAFHKSLLLLFFGIFLSAGIQAQGIEFFKGTWDDALELAKSEGKVIFVDAYASWCGPCKKMAKTTFVDEQVGTYYNNTFINMKLDMEKGEGLKFKSKYPVTAYPTLFWIDGSGKVVHKSIGGQLVDGLIKMGQMVANKANPVEDYVEAYEEGNRDPEFILEYVKSLNKSGQSSLKVANEYLNTQDDLSTPFNLQFILESFYEVDSRIFELFESDYAKISKLTTEKDLKQKIKRACDNTVKKGVEFEMEEFVDLAVNKMQKYYGDDADQFEQTAKMRYYKSVGNSKSFLKYADQKVKKAGKNNAAVLNEAAKDVFTAFPNDEKALNKAESYAAKSSAYGGLAEYYLLHAQILHKIGNSTEALAVAEQSLEIAKSNGNPTRAMKEALKMLINQIKQG